MLREILFFAWDQLPQMYFDMTRYSRFFFLVWKGARKNRLDFIHPRMFHGVKMCSLLISRRESLHRLNNHGMEVFADLSQHD